MDTALPQKFPFILDRNLVKANCEENMVCTSCDTVVLGHTIYFFIFTVHNNWEVKLKGLVICPKQSEFMLSSSKKVCEYFSFTKFPWSIQSAECIVI